MISPPLRLLLLGALLAPPASAVDLDAEAFAIHQLAADWQVPEARRRVTELREIDRDHPSVRYVHGRVLFFEGRYAEAHDVLEALVAELGDDTPRHVREALAEARQTRDTLKGFDEHRTPDGRFLVRYKGEDRVMVPYLVDVLQKADAALATDFAWKPEGQVLVEIYPSRKYLAAVSPLTEEDIETSGTIALCKYNRLMFTSPRDLVRGYGWRDTVAHEFVHYYVTKLSRNTVPIWLHEGIAKFQETRWRAPPGLGLDPPQEDLLARSLKEDKLVTFSQMHPSMAKLPSQEAAGLAFAEVHTVIAWLYERKGYAGISELIAGLRDGAKMDPALKAVYGFGLDGVWTRWKKAMLGRGLRTFPGLVQTSLRFKRPGDEEGEPEADYGTVEDQKAKGFTRLGEMFRARDRHEEAVIEYKKAMVVAGEGNPEIQNGAARSLIALGKAEDVPALLETVKRYYPSFLPTWVNEGEAMLAAGRREEAMAAFEEAIGINPFHPRPHEVLAKLYAEAGRAAEAERERKAMEALK